MAEYEYSDNVRYDRRGATVWHPGEFLAEEMAAREITPEQVARWSGLPLATIKSLLACEERFSASVCEALERALGISSAFWSNLWMAWQNAVSQESSGLAVSISREAKS